MALVSLAHVAAHNKQYKADDEKDEVECLHALVGLLENDDAIQE